MSETKNQPTKPVTQALTKLDDTKLVALAGSYVPRGQASKAGYIKLIMDKCMVVKDGQYASLEDLVAFMYTAYRTGLDPIANQLHTQFRWDGRLGKHRMVVITGIDGFRLTAQRSKLYGGQDDAVFEKEKLFNPVTNQDEEQLKATVTVYRINPKTGERMPITATARWNAYAVKDKEGKYQNQWATSPHLMLAKCAEALALRKAFPQDLSGVYTDDEMGSAFNDPKKDLVNALPTPETVASRKPQNATETTDSPKTGETPETTQSTPESGKTEEKPAQNKVVKNSTEAKEKLNELLDKKGKLNKEGNK